MMSALVQLLTAATGYSVTTYLLVAAATAILAAYWHYSSLNCKWKRRGIPGPKPELFIGNLREIWDFDKPKSLVISEWTKQFGKIYGFFEGQRPFIAVSDFETINDIVVKKFGNFHPRARQVGCLDGSITRTLEARGLHWKRLRELGTGAFTPQSLKNVLPTIDASAMKLVDGMERRSGEINMLEFFQEFTLDVLCKVALGMHDVRMFHNDHLDSCRGIFNRPLRHPLTVLCALFPFAADEIRGFYDILAKLGIVKSPVAVLTKMVKKTVAERKAQRTKGYRSTSDFIDILLNAEEEASEAILPCSKLRQMMIARQELLASLKPGRVWLRPSLTKQRNSRELSINEIVGQCMTYFLDGFDTTSNSLSFTTHFLANHPVVQKRLIEEVDAFLIENETISIERLDSDLPYMDGVINESLRHYPVASALVARECVKACEIGGFKFEVEDQIATDTWSMHMDESVWGADAREFRPERWLESADRPRCAFQPFGGGPRTCLGNNLANIMQKMALLKLLSRFTIEKMWKTNPIALVGSFTVAPEKVMVNLVRRNK